MKRNLILLFPLAAALSFASCGGKSGDEKVAEEEVNTNPANPIDAMTKMGNEMEKGNDAAQKKLAERRAKGDTLAMPYAELQKFLPASIDGYKKGEPDGQTLNMPGASYSTASANYTNDKGENIKVTLVDYNQAYAMYSAATMMWATGMSIDTPEEKAQGVKFEGDIGGWEVYHKKSKDVELTLGLGYRFWLQVEAQNQENTEMAKSIAKKMDLPKLASM